MAVYVLNKRLITLKMMTLRGKIDTERLTHERQLIGYRHERFGPYGYLEEKAYLEDLWQSGKAPWKVW